MAQSSASVWPPGPTAPTGAVAASLQHTGALPLPLPATLPPPIPHAPPPPAVAAYPGFASWTVPSSSSLAAGTVGSGDPHRDPKFDLLERQLGLSGAAPGSGYYPPHSVPFSQYGQVGFPPAYAMGPPAAVPVYPAGEQPHQRVGVPFAPGAGDGHVATSSSSFGPLRPTHAAQDAPPSHLLPPSTAASMMLMSPDAMVGGHGRNRHDHIYSNQQEEGRAYRHEHLHPPADGALAGATSHGDRPPLAGYASNGGLIERHGPSADWVGGSACAVPAPPTATTTAPFGYGTGAGGASGKQDVKASDVLRTLLDNPLVVAAAAGLVAIIVLLLVAPPFVKTRAAASARAGVSAPYQLARVSPLKVLLWGAAVSAAVLLLPLVTIKLRERATTTPPTSCVHAPPVSSPLARSPVASSAQHAAGAPDAARASTS